MRWVWRAESGGFKIEYGALVILVATVAVAVFSIGLPTDVPELYKQGVCRIADDADCEDAEGAKPQAEGADGEAIG